MENKLLLTNKKMRIEDGWLYQDSRLVVPDNIELKRTILEKFHDSPISGHRGISKTSELISRHFTWEKLIKDVEDYVRGCPKCQSVKAVQRKPAGLLYPNVIPKHPWEFISMD